MKPDIAINSELKAASFDKVRKIYPQVEMIVRLLVNSIETSNKITKEDILKSYLDWREKHGKKFILSKYNGWYWKDNGFDREYTYWQATREEYAAYWGTKSIAYNWFKTNLGAAIIAGKILAIPVIDIE